MDRLPDPIILMSIISALVALGFAIAAAWAGFRFERHRKEQGE